MKKYLMTGVAALALCAGFTACSHDDFTFSEEEYVQNQKEMVYAQYQQAFINAFGEPAKNHTWGFQMPTTTRAITINNTDTYPEFNFPSSEELAAAFPTSIPGNAKTDAQLATDYLNQKVQTQYGEVTMTDMYAVYLNIVGKTEMNIKVVEPGEFEVGHSYANPANQVYNVYISVGNGNNLTLKRNGAEHVNFYILSGNITFDSNFGECGGIISVASGAKVTDQRKSIAHNDGIKLYNRGTLYATNTQGYDIGNNSTIYNEGTFTVSGPMTYSPGSNNTSYFINFGDEAVLTAPSMTMNSTCHFFTEGTVNITGETAVTQAAITWINNGHYTTGSMRFSAKNTTFYNYCQLKVNGVCMFLDGEFNLMDNSYAEVNQGLFNNFVVNMGNNAGFNALNGTKWGRQAQGHFQGFMAKNDVARAYVRLGGQTYVPSHNGGAFHVQGANLTLAYENIKFYKSQYSEIGQYSNYNNISYGDETTAEALASAGDGNITWDIHNVTKINERAFAETGFTLTDGQCAADWIEPNVKKVRVICEDMFAQEKGDFDFNDAVFDLTLDDNGKVTWIDLIHTGAEFDIYVDGKEIHDALGLPKKSFGSRKTITADNSFAPSAGAGTKYPVEIEVYAVRNFTYTNEEGEKVTVNNQQIELKADQGRAPGKIQVKSTFEIPAERVPIDSKYESFKAWVQDASIDWEE